MNTSEMHLRSVFDNLYDAVIIHDLTGKKVLDVNGKLLAMFGITRADAFQLPLFEYFSETGCLPSGFSERWQAAIDGQHQLFEWKVKRPKDIKPVDIEVFLSRLKYGNRDVILSTLRDITLHKDSERRQIALTRISESASTSESLHELFLAFHEAIASVMPAENFYICLVDLAQQLLTFPYFVDQYDSNPVAIPINRGLTEYVIRSGKPLLADPEVFLRLERSGEVESVGAPSIDWLGVPLKIQDRIIGAMALQSYTEGVRFREDDLGFLSLVAPHVAMAIEHKRAEEELRQQHDFIKTIFDSSPDAILTVDLNSMITDCNQATLDLLDCSNRDEIIGHNAFDFVIPEDRETARQKMKETLKTGIAKHIEFCLQTKKARQVIVELSVSLITGNKDEPSFFIGHMIDISQRKRAEEALRISEERYSLAMLGANDGLWDWDLTTNLVYYSPRWKAMLGIESLESSSPEEWFKLVHCDDLPRLKSDIEAHIAGIKPQLEAEYRIYHTDGTYHWMVVHGIAVSRPEQPPHRLAGSQTDITSRKSTEQRLIHEALHDALTSLPNRVLFLDRLGQSLKRIARHPKTSFAVLFLDLDRFKVINDSLGHVTGDLVLIEMARRLEHCLRLEDTVARLGGDEFAILIDDLVERMDIVRIANRVQAEIASPFKINGQQVFTTVSIGIALGDLGYENPEEVLRDADTAMYHAKAQGGGRHVIFDKRMHTEAVRLLELETDLRQALEQNQFQVYYQPICSLEDGRVVGAEALLRWLHPERGLRYPAEFISLAEETGLIIPIGEWVLRTACKQLHQWRHIDHMDLTMAVNISARQFQQQDLPEIIRSLMQEFDIQPGELTLEVTESINLINAEYVEETLKELSRMGIEISMDDFGTGYSSLNTLKRLSINNVKIAHSFVCAISSQRENDLITASIIQMSHNLGFKVVAEGVETANQIQFLQREDCDLMQGFIVSPAVQPGEFETIYQNSHSSSPINISAIEEPGAD